MSAAYSEDRLVQQTTADFFKNTLGWESVYAFNSEKFGATGTLGRKDNTEVVLTRYLRQSLERLNPGHPDQAYEDAIQALLTVTSSQSLLQINEAKYNNAMVMLSNGIDARVGTIISPYKFFHEWRRLAENAKGRVHFETMLLGMCTKQNFLDLVQNFILFDTSGGNTAKILARNHQFWESVGRFKPSKIEKFAPESWAFFGTPRAAGNPTQWHF